jgi:hypothetical protein
LLCPLQLRQRRQQPAVILSILSISILNLI